MNIGILCDPRGLKVYQREALRLLRETEGVRLSFCFHVILPNEEVSTTTIRTPLSRLRGSLVDRLFPKTELERRTPDLPPLPRLPLESERRGPHSVYLTNTGVSLLKGLAVDVLVNFTTHILRGEILTVPRYGIWSYHHGDPCQFRGYPPGFWEIYHGAPTTGAILQKLEHRLDDGVVLRKATFPTISDSYYRQRQKLFSISVPWLSEVAAGMVKGEFPDLVKTGPPTTAPILSRPSNRELLKFGVILLRNKLASRVARLR